MSLYADFPDNRLNEFLGNFVQKGWFLIEFGFFDSSYELDPCLKDQNSVVVDAIEKCNFVIRNGFVVDERKIPHALNVLDTAGIESPLPAFDGKESIFYTINDDGNWIDAKNVNKEKFFYIVCCSMH